MTSEPQTDDLGAFTTKTAELVDILGQQEARHLTDIKSQTISEFVKVSLFEGLSLSEYALAKNVRCEQIHNCHNTCMKCSSLINAAKLVLEENVVPLPYLWNKCCPNMPYNSGKAQRKFLQMPVSAVTVNGAVYITEKKETHMDYASLRNSIHSNLIKSEKSYVQTEEYKVLLSVAQGEAEKKLLKHTLCSTQNLSRRQAGKMYGITKMQERAVEINKAAVSMKEINDRHLALAKFEQKQFLLSCGANIDEY